MIGVRETCLLSELNPFCPPIQSRRNVEVYKESVGVVEIDAVVQLSEALYTCAITTPK